MKLPQSFLVNSCQSAREWVIVWFWLEKNLDIVPELSNMFLSVWRTHCIKQSDVKVRTHNTWVILSNGDIYLESGLTGWRYRRRIKVRRERNTQFESERQWTTYLQYEVFYFYVEIKNNNLYPLITIEIEILACNHGYDLNTEWWNCDAVVFPVIFFKLCSGFRWRKLQTCQQWLSGYSNPQNVLGKSKI